jgi:LmeA-like phospholipid-binding
VKKPVKVTIIVLIVFAGVAVAADYGLAAAAEYQVSKKMRSQLNLADDPSVNIHGFPFITQALSGDYRDITVNATGVPAKNTLRDLEVDADLHDVRVKLSDLLSGNVSQVRVDEVDGQVKVKASDVGRLLNIPDLTISPVSLDFVLGAGAQDALQQREQLQNPGVANPLTSEAGVELSGSIPIAGEKTTVNAFGVISLANGGIQITTKNVTLSNGIVSGSLPASVLQTFASSFSTTLSSKNLPLPFAVQATGVQVESGALVVQGKATNILLSSGNLSQ